MTPEQIEATFPLGHKLPMPIVAICDYLAQYGYPISGCFELSLIGMEDLMGWFPNRPDVYQQFLPFGRGACGDIYAIWLHGESTPDTGPIVMFGSEGELLVLAETSLEFCRLLCLGYSEVGLDAPKAIPSEYTETAKFRDFMISKFGFTLPDTAESFFARAAKTAPDFKTFVRSNQS